MQVSIITLNFNKHDLTLKCIKSVYSRFEKEFENDEMEIIVVDNASADNSVELMEKEIKSEHYKNVSVFANNENSGFGKGCNIGAGKASGKYLLFLNNDTEVRDDGILKMAKFLDDHDETGILGGQLKNPDGSLQVSVGSFYNLGRILLLLLGMQRFGLVDKSPQKITQVDWVKGGLLMIRRDVFDKLHGFDEHIFMYTEDMELCYRAKLKGFSTYFYPDVDVLHFEHGSTNRTFAIVNIYKNLLYFYKKHKSVTEYFFVKFLLNTKAIILILIGKITGSTYLVKTYSEAIKNV